MIIGMKKKSNYKSFKNGGIKNPYDKTYRNIAMFGEPILKDGKANKQIYGIWKGMIDRCYCTRPKEKTYEECYVSDEWLVYSNFEKWFNENYYTIPNEKMALDKDILYKGNKVYSPDTAIFVPAFINLLIVNKKNYRGDYPIGVCFHKRDKVYTSSCNVRLDNGKQKRIHLGYFNNEIDAFNAYKLFKENHIKEIANQYKDYIPDKLYNALVNYKIEITD